MHGWALKWLKCGVEKETAWNLSNHFQTGISDPFWTSPIRWFSLQIQT